jgi:WD40 repeat protein
LNRKQMTDVSDRPTISPKFQTLELLKFDDEQIRQVLSRRTKQSATVERVMANEKLLDLLRRAVMAEYVLEALPDLEQSEKIDISRVYLYAVKRKMEQDIVTGRTFTSLADKLYFLCELAWEMLSEDKLSLNYREFPDRLRVLFKDEVREQKHLDHWHYDMMGQTMLIRNDDGDYSPAHKSLLEFFVAYKLAAELGLLADDFLELAQSQLEVDIDRTLPAKTYTWSEYWQRKVDESGQRKPIAFLSGFKAESPNKLQETFGKSPLTRAVLDLLKPALNLEVKYRKPNFLIDLIQSTKAADVEYSGGNAATILVELEANALEYHNLSGTNLAYTNLVNAGLRGTNLSDANLENCLTTRVFGTPNAIVMSKDDRQFITAHSDKTIRIWDRFSGRELKRLIGHNDCINCLSLSMDGHWLYSGSDDGTIKQWQISDGNCEHTFEGHQNMVMTIALSADGKLYSGSNNGLIKQWQISDGSCENTFEGHQSAVMTLAMNANGKLLYSGSRTGTIKQWQVSNGRSDLTFAGHQNGVMTIVLSADDKLYSGSDDGTIKQWKISDGSCENTFAGHQNGVMTIVLSADDNLYSGSRDCTIKQWKISDGSCENTFEDHQNWVNALNLSRDGQRLYSASHDRTIKEWNLSEGKCQNTFDGRQYTVSGIAISGGRQLLYSGSFDGIIKEWNIINGKCERNFDGHQISVSALAMSSDGKRFYSGSDGGMIKEWSLAEGNYERTFPQIAVNAIAMSRDGQRLYSGSDDRMIREWNLAGGNCERIFEGHQNWVMAIAMSSDERLYSGSNDGTIKEWDVTTGECLRSIDTRLCAGANITNVKGLTPAQIDSLIDLGAICDD